MARLEADIVGLQEVDRRVFRSWFLDEMELCRRAARATMSVFGFARWFGPGGRYGNALVVRGGIRSHEVIDLTVDPARERRVAIVAEVSVQGRSLTVAVTHLQTDRREALVQLRHLLERLSRVSGEVLLLGDLNLPPADVRSVADPAGFQVAGGANSSGVDSPWQRIDHVVVRGIEIQHVEVPRPPVSDHRPVVATLGLGAAPPVH